MIVRASCPIAPRRYSFLPGIALSLLGAAIGCARQDELDRQIDRIHQVLLDASQSGAMHCAPRQLAIAHSQLEFAQLEREQGFRSKAERHLRNADTHAEAARLLSTPRYCASHAAPPPAFRPAP